MRAIVRDRYGPADGLKLVETDPPSPGDDDVRLRVRGSSINMADRLVMKGTPYILRFTTGLFRPKQPVMGSDVAGVVESVGANVTEWAVGDELYGDSEFAGTWAESVVVPAERLARAPANVPLAEAGAIPLAAMTALDAVREHGRVKPGQRVLVNGGSGSVGSYVVQLARAAGAEVTAVCSARNADRARELGAAHVVDYAREDFVASAAEPWDVLLDVAGSRPLKECLKVVKRDGTFVAIGGPVDGRWLKPLLRPMGMMIRGLFAKQRVVVFVSTPTRAKLDALREMVEANEIRPAFDSECELADLPAVMGEVERGDRRGKVLVRVE